MQNVASLPSLNDSDFENSGKIILSYCWDADVVILAAYLQRGATIKGNYYADLTSKMQNSLMEW